MKSECNHSRAETYKGMYRIFRCRICGVARIKGKKTPPRAFGKCKALN